MWGWGEQLPVLLVGLLVVFAPGILALRPVGLRGLGLVAAAPLFGVAATGAVALALGALGIPWSAWSWGLSIVLVVGATASVGRVLRGRVVFPRPDVKPRVFAAALVVAILLGLWRLVSYIEDPAGISQTNDAVFHMNAVQFILETMNASSLHVNSMIGGNSFYPASWHGIVSIMVLLTGASIPVAANMLTLVIGAFIWPLGLAWLVLVITKSYVTAGAAAVLSGALQTFPLLMFQWGVLFPNALSTAMLPAAVALVIAFPLWQADGKRWRGATRGLLFSLLVFAALMLAQPATLLPWLALVLVRATAWLLQDAPILSPMRRWGLVAGGWLLLLAFWVLLSRSTSGSHWPPFRGKAEAFLDVLFNGQVLIPFAFGVSILMLWGLIVAWRVRSWRWLVFAWIGLSTLYILVAAIGAPLVREDLLGAWYADPYRIAALGPVVAIPLAAIGLHDVVSRSVKVLGWRSSDEAGANRVATVSLVAASILMVAVVLVRPVAMPGIIGGTYDAESRYIATDDTYLSIDERTLLESLGTYVEPGQRVIANPSTGAGFGYMLSAVDVYPRTWSAPDTDAWDVIAHSLNEADKVEAVCDALTAYDDPGYVLDFGPGENTPGRYEMPGMTGFDDTPGFELVAEVGDVSLWRITACAR